MKALKIVENSKFSKMIRGDSEIIDDRGSKGIDQLLKSVSCTLTPPPSFTKRKRLTKEQLLAVLSILIKYVLASHRNNH